MKDLCVKEIMNQHVVAVHLNDDILDALNCLIEHRVSSVPVLDGNNNIVGFVSDFDFMKFLSHSLYQGIDSKAQVEAVMKKDVIVINENEDLYGVSEKFFQNKIKHAPVVDRENHLVGMVSRRDILCKLNEESAKARGFKSSYKGGKKLEVEQNKRVKIIFANN